MHEIGLCESILMTVEERAGQRPVARIGVRSGLLNHVDQDAMQQSFTLVAQGHPSAQAELELEVVPGRTDCQDCKAVSEVTQLYATCPSCGSPDIVLDASDELVLKWIEYVATEVGTAEPERTG
jgi:hydrogenase nickel incorporation protein HypA/HybF